MTDRMTPERLTEIMLRCEWTPSMLGRMRGHSRVTTRRWLTGKLDIDRRDSEWLERVWVFLDATRALMLTEDSEMEPARFDRIITTLAWDGDVLARVWRIHGSDAKRMLNGVRPIPAGIARDLECLLDGMKLREPDADQSSASSSPSAVMGSAS